tara:strand:+ start:1333 stop:2067 length:735 start_codon:yes stop_codon:yes gene_type:complete
MKSDEFKENLLTLICAKCNSEGVKKKNLVKINGKTLLGLGIIKAQQNNLKYICVSSEDNLILNNAKKYGVKPFFKRNKNLSLQNVAKEDVWKDAIKRAEIYFKKTFKYVLDIDITNPLLDRTDLDQFLTLSLKKLKSRWNGVFCVSDSRRNPYFNILIKNNKNGFKRCLNKPFKEIYSRQKAPKTYDHIAGYYCFRKDYLLKKKNSLFEKNIYAFKVEQSKAFDIDTLDDLKIIRILHKNINKK